MIIVYCFLSLIRYGCPSMDEIEAFSRQYKKSLDEEIPDDLALEVIFTCFDWLYYFHVCTSDSISSISFWRYRALVQIGCWESQMTCWGSRIWQWLSTIWKIQIPDPQKRKQCTFSTPLKQSRNAVFGSWQTWGRIETLQLREGQWVANREIAG